LKEISKQKEELMNPRLSESPTPVLRGFPGIPGTPRMSGTPRIPGTPQEGSLEQGLTVAIDPITLMVNECMLISSSMRKMTRWSQSGVAAILGAGDIFGNEEDSLNLGLTSLPTNIGSKQNNDNPLFSSFLQLRSILTEATDLFDLDSLTLLQPFLLAIKSSSTSGHITSLALNSISKFLTYEIISFRSKNLQSTLIQIISSLTHCRFEAADQNSDDAVLLKVLRLLEVIIESPLSNLLPNEVISEVVQTCLSLACNKKRSEVLRKSAEMSMVSITFRIFSKLRDIEPELVEELQTNFQNTTLPEDTIGGTDLKPSFLGSSVSNSGAATPINNSDTEESTVDESTEFEEQFGIVCINEFLGILISMISPSNQYQHMESTRVFALSLINTAIEVAGLEIPKHHSLLSLVSDPILKHILQIMTTTDSPALLQASLQVFSTVAIVLGKQLKSQIELTFTLIFQTILPEVGKKQSDNIGKANVSSRNSASKEMLVESLSLLWTRSPVFFTHLFIDYDCDFEKSDLAFKTLEFLCQLSLPDSALITTDNVPPICLESVLSFISGINDRIKSLQSPEDMPIHDLIQDKEKKTSFIKCTELLNESPKQGLLALAENGFLHDPKDITEVAKFFYNKSRRLNKKVLGEFLAKPSNTDLFRKFVEQFDFTDLRVDEALRILLKAFRLPGESQQISRIVETFADRYVTCQGDYEEDDGKEEAVRPDRDSIFVLSFSIIMLNTDLHNPQVKKPMQLEDYYRNLRGMYNGKNFPDWYLSKIYDSIKDREIIMPEEHHGTHKWFDDTWHNMISSQAEVNDENADISLEQICQFDKVLFETVVDKITDTLISVFKEATDDHVITRLMSSIDKCANICLYYNLSESVDKLIGALSDLTSLTSSKQRIQNSNDNLRDEIPITQIKIEKKEEVITVSEMAVWFGRDFKAQLSTVVLFRLIKKSDCKVTSSWDKIIRIVLTLFENCLINPNLFAEFQKKIKLAPLSKVKPRYIINKAKPLNNSGLLSTFSSFLKGYSDEPPEPTEQEIESALSTIDCVKSINISAIFEVISKGSHADLKLFVELLLEALPVQTEETKRYYETETLFIFEIMVCFCLILYDIPLIKLVLGKLNQSELSKKSQMRVVTYKLLLTRQSDDSVDILETIKTISVYDGELISKQGAPLLQPLLSLVDDDSWCCQKLISDEEYWKALRMFGTNPIFAKEILAFVGTIVTNSPQDIKPSNYMSILGLLDEISSLGAIGSQYEQDPDHSSSTSDVAYYKDLIQLSKKSLSLTTELSTVIKRNEFNGKDLSYSLIQALAHQCFNPCREIRSSAINSLQGVVLSVEVDEELTLFGIFEYGIFPLLTELTKLEVLQTDVQGFVATQVETLSLTSKVFLNFCTDFKKEETDRVWLGILDHFIAMNNLTQDTQENIKNDKILNESGPELLKNMILVLQSNDVLSTDVWTSTWEKIDNLYPELKKELGNQVDTERANIDEKVDKVVEEEDQAKQGTQGEVEDLQK
jgi:brefeldin A-resistance guanine nucleotide exchange factor 1